MAVDISRVDSRDRAPIRRSPYWRRITEGKYLGFRKMTKGAEGTWLARYYDGGRYVNKALGDFAQLTDKDRYTAAKEEAERWFTHLNDGGAVESGTVFDACVAYILHLKREKHENQHKAASAVKGAAAYLRRVKMLPVVEKLDDIFEMKPSFIGLDPLASVDLSKLTKVHVNEYRARMLEAYPVRSTFNRAIAAPRAALNLAKESGKIASDVAWAKALKPFREGVVTPDGPGRRTLYLSPEERIKLLAHTSEVFKPMLTAMLLLPVRPGDVPAARVKDLNVREGTLFVDTKDHPRHIPLPTECLEHLKRYAKDKLPEALLIPHPNGKAWRNPQWGVEIRLAAVGAGLPRKTCAYTLRHSVITDLVTSGLDLFTIAQVAGTSVAMIEKYYGHLQRHVARDGLAMLTVKAAPKLRAA